jgi:Fur family ferric uptake transcriptional regulator
MAHPLNLPWTAMAKYDALGKTVTRSGLWIQVWSDPVGLGGNAMNALGKVTKDLAKNESYRWFWEAFDDYLARHHLKETKQRRRVVELFITMNTHASAEDLHEATRKAGQNIGLATVYRTLNMLADAGLVEQKSFGDGRHLFELKHPEHHHDHLICMDCGAVIEFENEAIEALQEKVAAEHGFQLVTHRLDLFGRCQKAHCDKRPNSP